MINSTSSLLFTNSSISTIESTVLFQNVRRSDEGLYRCKAVNVAGESVKNVTFNVTCKYYQKKALLKINCQ